MKTFYDIIKDVSAMRGSIDNPEPDSFSDTDKAARLAVPQAHSYIWGLSDFPFKKKKAAIVLKPGESAVLAPKGTILSVRLDQDYLIPLQIAEADVLPQKSGKPEYFWVEFTEQGAALNFYPVPDKETTVIVRYEALMKARDAAGNEKANLEDMNDVLNLPEDGTIEDLYLNCLTAKAMRYLIVDESDEYYAPYERKFEEAYRTLLGLTGIKRETRLVI